VSGGLTRRMAIASGLLALIIAGAFAVLLWSVADLLDSQRLAKHSQEVLAAANRLERLIIDVETGQRGFAITQEDRFLQPWREAQAALPEAARTLERLTVVPAQHSRALRITQAAASYVEDYSVPLVANARRDPASARTEAITEAGKQRVDVIRAEFDGLVAAEGGLAAARQVDELRELSRGIHPAILSEGGLGPALKVLARRSPVPVELEVHLEGRLPAPVEVAAYYVIAEALTNAAKHANASVVHVDVRARAGLLRLAVEDDGVGGADPSLGTGLVGLSDRVQALGGTITVHSPAGQGTRLLIKLVFDREDG
jgi:CHASE3 domain sensor protein